MSEFSDGLRRSMPLLYATHGAQRPSKVGSSAWAILIVVGLFVALGAWWAL